MRERDVDGTTPTAPRIGRSVHGFVVAGHVDRERDHLVVAGILDDRDASGGRRIRREQATRYQGEAQRGGIALGRDDAADRRASIDDARGSNALVRTSDAHYDVEPCEAAEPQGACNSGSGRRCIRHVRFVSQLAGLLHYTGDVFRRSLGCVFALIAACGEGEARRLPGGWPDAGRFDSGVVDASLALPDGSLALPDCIDRARWIYVVDQGRRLLRFEPTTLGFHDVSSGPLACPTTATPFSMAVDRDAVAWILYSDGRIYRASTVDGACVGTTHVPNQQGVSLFGMGFSAVSSLGPDENLYIAGSDGMLTAFGIVDTTTFAFSVRGAVVGTPELTGNALAELWGFFPEPTVPRVAKLDRSSGAEVESYELATLGPDFLGTGDPRSWAFAYWGGDYYIFHRTQTEASTSVYRFHPGVAASMVRVIADSGLDVVGAGVSTCVPYVIE